jgi:hypothetical protein
MKQGCWIASAAVFVAFVGCGSKPAANKPETTSGNQAAQPGGEEEKIAAELASLSSADRELAIKQRICPVSDERLGTPGMGAPPKVEVKGHTVFICCESCRQSLVDEPDKYLAKLGIATAATPVGK